MIHNFNRSLRKSHACADAPWWREVYERAFPGCLMQDMRNDGWWQRAGIDRRLHLPNATTITVDEKCRYQDWPDFALEAFSKWDENPNRRVAGWMETLASDYLAYAFVPSRRCYLLPIRELQRIYHANKFDWWNYANPEYTGPRLKGFMFADADNGSYITRSIAVPIGIVLDSIRDSLLVTWGDRA